MLPKRSKFFPFTSNHFSEGACLVSKKVNTEKQNCLPNKKWLKTRRGEGGGGIKLPIYGIVRMCVPNSPLFQCCQVYDWPPFFNKKYMNGPIFLDSYVKGPIFLTSWYMHIFFAQRFFEAAYSLGIT